MAVEQFINRDIAVGLYQDNGRKVLLVSAYLDIKLEVIQDWFKRIIDYANKKKYGILLCVDSNSHSVLFGEESNSRGEALEEFIIKHSLIVENVGTEPTFETMRKTGPIQTTIDVTLSRGLPSTVVDWKVHREYNGSDHNTITFGLGVDQQVTPELIRIWDNVDWHFFGKEMNNQTFRK